MSCDISNFLAKMAATRRFEDDKTKTKTTRSKDKKPLPAPSSVGDFVVLVVMRLCKKILLVDTSVKIGVYLIGVMLGSVFADLVQLPKSYFSNKHNLLNQLFVKFGWGWTLCGLVYHIGLTSYVYTLGKWNMVKVHLLRLCIASFWWYTMTSLFLYVESVVGVCSDKKYFFRDPCLKNGKAWLGFDISGHIFLLIHSLLTISEEVRLFKDWKRLGEMLQDNDFPKSKNIKSGDVKESCKAYKALNSYVKIGIVILAVLMVIWEFMLIISTIYRFHTTSQKISSAFLAVGCWFVSYKVILGYGQTGSLKLLKKPGESDLNFTRVK
ncbi:hypothetical protein FSP39_017451 [Pinctada imbricata]|uniref:Uncharacterized protein n=1 Tax=Pinctada imbricata TaxID=66713 RepID=A0AA88XJ73_PINIB|nr:hypothetical protein FSP39_017451 [Pinctada imbricata]